MAPVDSIPMVSIYLGWTPENKSNEYPAATFNDDGGRFLGLQNRAFVRLQDVTLSYTFREPWGAKSKYPKFESILYDEKLIYDNQMAGRRS